MPASPARDFIDDAVRLAGVHRRAGRLAEALAVYAHALERAPGNARLVRGLAALTAATGDPANAISLYSRALRDNPDDIEALNNRGVMFLQLGDAQAATDCLRRAAALAPHDAAIQGNLGNAVLALGDGVAAEQHLRAAWALAPADARGAYNLAHALAAIDPQAHADERRALLEQALTLDPDHVPARVNLANLLLQAGEAEAALAEYDAALLREPLAGLVLHNRAHALAGLGRWDAALADLAQARGLVVGPHRIDLLMGEWYHRLGRLDDALAALVRAAEARPDLAEPWLALAALLRDQGRLVEALDTLDQIDAETGASLRAEILRQQRGAPPPLSATEALALLQSGTVADDREIIALLRRIDPADGAALHDLLPTAFAPLLPVLAARPWRSAPNRSRPWPAPRRGNAPRLGLCWRHAGQTTGPDQDLTLADLLPLLDAVPGAEWVALASPITRDEASQMHRLGIDNAAADARDYEDVLTLAEGLDLLIGCDAPMPLLAAAAGRPCWLVLPAAPRFVWGMGGTGSPDWPGVALFRQTRPLSWREPVQHIAHRLRAQFGG